MTPSFWDWLIVAGLAVGADDAYKRREPVQFTLLLLLFIGKILVMLGLL